MHGALRIINVSGTKNTEDKLSIGTTDSPGQTNVILTWVIPSHVCAAYRIEFLAVGQVNHATWGHIFINSENHFLIRKLISKVGVYHSHGYFLKLSLETFDVGTRWNIVIGIIKLAEIR